MSASPPTASTRCHDARRDRLALEAAGLGVWELDLTTGRSEWNAEMFALHGLPPDGPALTFAEWLTRVHPDDRGAVEAAFRQLLVDPAPLTTEFRILRDNGEVRHLRAVTRSLHDEETSAHWLVGINEDVTERVRDRRLAEAKRSELQTFFDVSLSLMGIATLDGRILVVNEAWQRVLGHRRSGLLGTNILALVHTEDIAATEEALGKLHKGQNIVDFVHRLHHRDGSYRHIEWRATAKDGRIYATAHDVSSRVELERKVAAERSYLQLIIDSLPSPVFAKDWQGRHTLANRSVAALFGTTPAAMIGRTDAELSLPPDVHAKFQRDDREVMSTGHPKSLLELPMVDPKGNVRWYQVIKVPLMAERPVEERQVVGIATDVTDRERNEQRLRRQEALYRSLVESQQDLIVRIDIHDRFTFVNDAYCHTFGKSREELIGRTFTPLVHEDDLAHTMAAIDKLKQPPHHRVTIVQRAMTKNGWRWLSWEDDAILDEAGNLLEIQAVGRDITELKQAQQRALSSSRAKGQFLANMSHEIRTPLNAIIGFGELLAQSPLDAEQQDWIDKINASSSLLLSIVNDVLDYSKIEAGKLELERVPFTLEQLATQQQALFAVATRVKGLRFRVTRQGDAPPALVGDPLRLGQVLTNLVGNAVKFTPQGEVGLAISARSLDAARCRLTCRVTDTGIGISAAQRQRLFEAFTQADSSTSRRFGGTGLGLVISQRLIEQMGGTLEVSSVPGEGSCFSFSLTLPVSAAPSEHPVDTLPLDTRGLAGKRVLLAEDSLINQALARRLLEDLGLQVVLANNGREALEHLKSVEVDLVLMDLQMPVMDGFETTRRIRQHDAALPIIALSAAVLAEERRKALVEGMNEHLAKPIDSQRLAAALMRWLSDVPHSPTEAAQATAAFADDSDAAWLDTLEAHGFDTQAGLATAAADPDLYRQVLGVFLEQLTSRFAALSQPDAGLDATPELMEDLHTLKGTAGSLGAMDIAESARHLEACLKQYGHARQEDTQRLSRALEQARRGVTLILSR